MCSLLTLFIVVGSHEPAPGIVKLELLNDGVIEEYIVPKKQYEKCFTNV